MTARPGAAARLARLPGSAEFATLAGRPVRLWHRPAPGTTPPLVLCNGLGVNLELAARFAAATAPRPLLLFDAPGVGRSPRPLLPMSFSELADLVAVLLDRFGYGQAHIVGYSWGGGIAQEFAHRHPDRCRRLVLAATTAGALMVPGSPAALWSLFVPGIRSGAHDVFAASLADATGHDDLTSEFIPLDTVGYSYQLITGLTWSSAVWLGCLTCPTLLLAAVDDRVVPCGNATILQRLIPRAEHRLIAGGHMSFLTNPERYVAYLDAFLDSAGDP